MLLINHLKMKFDSGEHSLHLLTLTWFAVRQIQETLRFSEQ